MRIILSLGLPFHKDNALARRAVVFFGFFHDTLFAVVNVSVYESNRGSIQMKGNNILVISLGDKSKSQLQLSK